MQPSGQQDWDSGIASQGSICGVLLEILVTHSEIGSL